MTEQQVPREQVMKTAIGFINQYDGALKELAAIEKAELIAELEVLRKENFQKVADCCVEEYNKKYGERPEDQYWMYMIADYYATGEGQTTCLMVTQANALSTDYVEGEHYKELNTKEYRAVRAFHKEFGTWHLHGLRFLSKDDFYRECVYYLPPVMMKLSNTKCFQEFHTMVHYNFG